MITAEYKCGYCGSTFKLSYFNSVDIPERNVGCTNCRMAGADVKLIKKIRDERDMKKAQTSNLLYPITVLESERDGIHGIPKNRADQLNRAIEILNEVKMKDAQPKIGVYLTIRESKILCLRYKKKTLYEIAKMFKVTTERIRQIEAKAIRKLERGIKAQEEKKEGD